MTQKDNGPGPGRNYGYGRFYVWPKSGFWPQNGSYPKKSPKMTFPPLIIWAKGPFFFEQLFSVVARTWLGLKSGTSFLGPKFWFLVQKSDFCHTTPILVDDPFLALGMTVNFPHWERFFDFPFRSYSSFRKKICWPVKKSSTLPLWGHRLPVKALALSARGLDNYDVINNDYYLLLSLSPPHCGEPNRWDDGVDEKIS